MQSIARRAWSALAGFCAVIAAGGVIAFAQTAAPSPTSAPVAVPSASAAPAPRIALNVDRHRLIMAPGATAQVHVFGASSVDVRSSFDGVAVVFDAPSRTLRVVARDLGSGTILVSNARGESDSIAVSVVPPAGVVPPQTTIALVGKPTAAFAIGEIRAALRRNAQLAPGCSLTIDLKSADVPALDKPSVALDVAVKLGGPNFADVAGLAHVVLTVDPAIVTRDPATLLYSDDPETASTDGVLFSSTATIDATHSARVYAYHEAADAGRNVYLVVRTLGKASHVQLVGSSLGPSGDYNCVGHEATLLYLEHRNEHEGIAVDVAPSSPYVVQLNSRPMPPRTLVVGVFDVHVAAGDPVQISVVTAAGNRDPLSLLSGRELPSDGHHRRGEYSLQNTKPLVLSYTVGQDDAAAGIGYAAQNGTGEEFQSVRPDGWSLNGEYGVLRSLRLELKNPTAGAQTVYFYEVPANGADTTTLWFDGDAAPLEVARVDDPNARYLLRTFQLAPQQSLSVNLLFMADGASWYPLQLGLTKTPPSAPPATTFGACFEAIKATVGRGSFSQLD